MTANEIRNLAREFFLPFLSLAKYDSIQVDEATLSSRLHEPLGKNKGWRAKGRCPSHKANRKVSARVEVDRILDRQVVCDTQADALRFLRLRAGGEVTERISTLLWELVELTGLDFSDGLWGITAANLYPAALRVRARNPRRRWRKQDGQPEVNCGSFSAPTTSKPL